MDITLGNIIAALALGLSAYATWGSHRFKKKEGELMDLQGKVNSLILEKEQREAEQAGQADLGASFVSIGSKKNRLKIFNKGKMPAYNVNITFLGDNDIVLDSEIENKFPMEHIDPGQAVELMAAVHMQTKRKHAIRLRWSDPNGGEREKDVYPTL